MHRANTGHWCGGFLVQLTDPEVDVIQEKASKDLVQGPVHLQPCRSPHQPLQQLFQLFSYVLTKNLIN